MQNVQSMIKVSLRSGCFLGERATRDRAAIELAVTLDARAKEKLGREKMFLLILFIYHALTIRWYGTHNSARLQIKCALSKKKRINTTNLNTFTLNSKNNLSKLKK